MRWKNITKRKKAQTRYLNLLLNDAIHDKKITLQKLTTETTELKHQPSQRTTWMKYKLICFSFNRLLSSEKTKIVRRHQNKLPVLTALKRTSDGITENPNEIIVNLTNHSLSSDELNVLKLGLRYGLATRSNQLEIKAVDENVWRQVSRLDIFKEGRYVQDKIKTLFAPSLIIILILT